MPIQIVIRDHQNLPCTLTRYDIRALLCKCFSRHWLCAEVAGRRLRGNKRRRGWQLQRNGPDRLNGMIKIRGRRYSSSRVVLSFSTKRCSCSCSCRCRCRRRRSSGQLLRTHGSWLRVDSGQFVHRTERPCQRHPADIAYHFLFLLLFLGMALALALWSRAEAGLVRLFKWIGCYATRPDLSRERFTALMQPAQNSLSFKSNEGPIRVRIIALNV